MLGERLETAIQLAGTVRHFADIGADHGFLSAELLKRNPTATGIVTDISEKALAKARGLMASLQLESRVVFEVADGLVPLKEHRVQTAFVLGMGGDTIAGILLRGKDFLGETELILGGHTELPPLRETVYQVGYHIEEEAIAREKDRFYFLLRCLPGQKEFPSEEELYLGAFLMKTMPEVWLPYLQKQKKYLSEGITAMKNAEHVRQEKRKEDFTKKLLWVEQMLKRYEWKDGNGYENTADSGLAE